MKRIGEAFQNMVDALRVERVAVVLSIFYCVGVILQLQFNAIFVGDFDFDFVRVKPIIVGVEYFLYLLLPLAVVYVPIILTSKKCCGWFWDWYCSMSWCCPVAKGFLAGMLRAVVCLLLSSALAFVFGVMFHYFVPYTEYLYVDDGFIMSLVKMAWAFWQLYTCWDLNLLAFLALLIAGLFWVLRYCEVIRFDTRGRKRMFVCIMFVCTMSGFFTNMFYFNRDVYLNISQAAAGGAPISGIITISSPSGQARKGLDGRANEGTEVTKFCSIMQADSSNVYICDRLVNDRGISGGTHSQVRTNITRIKREDVKQFTPLKLPMRYRYGRRTLIAGPMLDGMIYNLDLFLEFHFTAESEEVARLAPHWLSLTNEIKTVWQGDDFPVQEAPATNQRVVKEGASNLCYTVEFQGLPVPLGTSIPELFYCMTNKYAECVTVNLPKLPNGLRPHRVAAGFLINYFYSYCWYNALQTEYGKVLSLERGGKLPKNCENARPQSSASQQMGSKRTVGD